MPSVCCVQGTHAVSGAHRAHARSEMGLEYRRAIPLLLAIDGLSVPATSGSKLKMHTLRRCEGGTDFNHYVSSLRTRVRGDVEGFTLAEAGIMIRARARCCCCCCCCILVVRIAPSIAWCCVAIIRLRASHAIHSQEPTTATLSAGVAGPYHRL